MVLSQECDIKYNLSKYKTVVVVMVVRVWNGDLGLKMQDRITER